LAAPKGKPAEDVMISPALVQILAEPGPIHGRKIGVSRVRSRRRIEAGEVGHRAGCHRAGDRAPFGGVLKAGRRSVTVDRTLVTARSIEFDALVVAGGTTPDADIKLVVLLQEAFRHCKVIAAWGDGTAILQAAAIAPTDPGVQIADSLDGAFTTALAAGLGLHRAWDRAALVMASAVPPAR
jgi:catalase